MATVTKKQQGRNSVENILSKINETTKTKKTKGYSTLNVFTSRIDEAVAEMRAGDSDCGSSSDDNSFDSQSMDSMRMKSRTGGRSSDYSRSVYDESVDTSCGSLDSWASRVTAREMINDIKLHAERNLRPPEYVPRLDELAPHLISWNRYIQTHYTTL